MKRRTQKGRKQKGAKGCWSGKTRFRDKSSAQGALRNVKGSGTLPVRAYECPGCNGWHLTSKDG